MTIDERVKQIMADVFHVHVDTIDDDTTPHTLEHWDSVNHMYVVFAIEDEFNIELTEDQMIAMMDGVAPIVRIVSELSK